MVYMKVQLLGDGTEGNPYRADMQNYSMVDVDYANMFTIVSVGPRDAPSPLPPQGTPLYPFMGDKFVLIGLTPEALASWWTALAKRYPRQDPPFQPEFAE